MLQTSWITQVRLAHIATNALKLSEPSHSIVPKIKIKDLALQQ